MCSPFLFQIFLDATRDPLSHSFACEVLNPPLHPIPQMPFGTQSVDFEHFFEASETQTQNRASVVSFGSSDLGTNRQRSSTSNNLDKKIFTDPWSSDVEEENANNTNNTTANAGEVEQTGAGLNESTTALQLPVPPNFSGWQEPNGLGAQKR